jgi:rhodanese-related sulfurtransferase
MSTETMHTISPRELADLISADKPIRLIDVRTPAEFEEAHVACARNVPLDSLTVQGVCAEGPPTAENPLFVICRSGGRGGKAQTKLSEAGVLCVINVTGGTLACIDAGLPVTRGKKTISLERQVRIAAGSLVLIGAALGYFVDPLGIGLSAFIGAGLVFAGITDTCGMGMLLAKMPWNQCSSSRGCSSKR